MWIKMKNIYEIIKENREEAIATLSALPNKEVKLLDNLNWDTIEEDGILADEDAMDNEELRDLPCVVIATDQLYEVIVLKVFLTNGGIHFYGVRIEGCDNYLVREIETYNSCDCAACYENVLYEIVEDYTNISEK